MRRFDTRKAAERSKSPEFDAEAVRKACETLSKHMHEAFQKSGLLSSYDEEDDE